MSCARLSWQNHEHKLNTYENHFINHLSLMATKYYIVSQKNTIQYNTI